ncbi:MAG TPA: hypothetical protein VNZ43_02845 [Sphingomonadaceae bacterium]|nr:hypothetical protein [Sphingomonadaceae bacterium]
MRGAGLDRRGALTLGGAALAAGLLPAVAEAARTTPSGAGVLLFDPHLPEARALAGTARGRRLIAVAGDPARLWRDQVPVAGPVSGVTRWSDYLVLREFAHDSGRRIRREERHAVHGQPLLVSWTAA